MNPWCRLEPPRLVPATPSIRSGFHRGRHRVRDQDHNYLPGEPLINWHAFFGSVGNWFMTRGLPIALLIIGSLIASRLIRWAAHRVTRRLDLRETDALVRSETTKHRQAVAGVISWVTIVILYTIVAFEIVSILNVPVGSLVAPAAVLGAALGFGAQRLVQDLLSGFFIITEKQYGFGDLVELTVTGATKGAGSSS
jgi:small-conductance mechanosensitive channel